MTTVYINDANTGDPVAIDFGSTTISGAIIARSPTITVDNDYTGIITITTSGVPVNGNNVPAENGFYLKAHVDNTDTVWLMPHSRTKANGFPLNKGEVIVSPILNLNLLDFDSDVNGGKICWAKC